MAHELVPFYNVPSNRRRGTWVYGVSVENCHPSEKLVFGCIQGLDLSQKALLYGVEVVGTRGLTWIPEWMVTHDPANFAPIAIKLGFSANDCREFVEKIEQISWVKLMRVVGDDE